MAFKIEVEVGDDGSSKWTMSTESPNVVVGQGVGPLYQALGWAIQNAQVRVPTSEEAEALAMVRAKKRALPDGWEPTLDGVNVQTGGPAPAYSKAFHRVADGATVDAPCDPDGSPNESTRAVLVAYEKDNPVQVAAEA